MLPARDFLVFAHLVETLLEAPQAYAVGVIASVGASWLIGTAGSCGCGCWQLQACWCFRR